jgi:glycine cleavage system aminomethyltransferase T
MPHARSPVARTPLHHWHAAHGSRFAERAGWQVVSGYSTVEREVVAARAGLGLADVSAWAKLSLRGPGVRGLAPSLVAGGAALGPRGVLPRAQGPGLVCGLTEEHLLVLGSSSAPIALGGPFDAPRVVPTDATAAYAGFWLMGPRLEELLRRLTDLDVRPAPFPVGSCAETALAGVEALLVQTPELSLPSMRIYVAWDVGEYVWERMMETGRDIPVAPLGLEALGVLGVGPGSAVSVTLVGGTGDQCGV